MQPPEPREPRSARREARFYGLETLQKAMRLIQDPVVANTRPGCRALRYRVCCQDRRLSDVDPGGSTSCPFLPVPARFSVRILRFFSRTSGFKSPSSHFRARPSSGSGNRSRFSGSS